MAELDPRVGAGPTAPSRKRGVESGAPVLVLALGNRLLRDDGVGVQLLSLLEPHAQQWGTAVELIDGGTRGLALMGAVQGRAATVVLDAVRMGAEPGSVHILSKSDLMGFGGRASTAHEGGVTEILAALALLGGMPEQVVVVGVEPATVDTGIGLSAPVEARLPEALSRARAVIEQCVSQEALAGL